MSEVTKPKSNQIWMEEYRPKGYSQVVGNHDVFGKLDLTSKQIKRGKYKGMIHLLMSGPSGCGKTTTMRVFARDMLGYDERLIKDAVLELHASDGRDILKTVKNFCKTKVVLPEGKKYKLVLVDEVDSLSDTVQSKLYCVMEDWEKTTQFVFTCNQRSKVAGVINSHCSKFEFSKLRDRDIERRLKFVLYSEGVKYDEEGMKALLFFADGDMRAALSNAQACFSVSDVITMESVYQICDMPNPEKVRKFFHHCVQQDLHPALQIIKAFYNEGKTAQDIIDVMFRTVRSDPEVPEPVKQSFYGVMQESHVRSTAGLGTATQLDCMVANLCQKAKEFQNH